MHSFWTRSMLDAFEEGLMCKDVWFRYLLTAPNFLLHSLLHKLSFIHFYKILLKISAEMKKKYVFSIKTRKRTSMNPLRRCKHGRVKANIFIPSLTLKTREINPFRHFHFCFHWRLEVKVFIVPRKWKQNFASRFFSSQIKQMSPNQYPFAQATRMHGFIF